MIAIAWGFSRAVSQAILCPIVRSGLANSKIFRAALPMLVLLAVWIISFLVIRWKQQRQLWREIEELTEADSSSLDSNWLE